MVASDAEDEVVAVGVEVEDSGARELMDSGDNERGGTTELQKRNTRINS